MENKVLAHNEIETDEKCNTLLCLNELKPNYKNLECTKAELEKTVTSKKDILENKTLSTKKCYVDLKTLNKSQINNLECNDNKDLLKNDKQFYENSDDVNLSKPEVSNLLKKKFLKTT